MTSRTLLLGLCVFAFAAVGCVAGEEEEIWGEEDLVVTDEDQTEDEAFNSQVEDGKADAALSYVAVARLAKTAGVQCTGDRIALATAVAKAESGFRPQITNTVGNARGIDRGLWQVNSYWHPEVSASCALSASCNARAMARISRGGTRWTEWWTWKNGKHLPFLAQSRTAQRTVCAE